MSSKPTHRAYIVNQGKDGKSYWRDVGAVWPHSKGDGFHIAIYEGLAVSGRIVCTEPKEPGQDDAEHHPQDAM